ncbi:hypothetical protein [Poritiphilus flavus]|uniref:ParB/Sulfiredoxin domain-containing protein n=1 Tax=Poritiphilus flavus TaxID=2697053 RepID=A0A6L9EG86_9FLAO|nr:hypothetical protein [Poritiphilus flavus]NAS13701.1 hypothetical protein [Poritiphilus flavus]
MENIDANKPRVIIDSLVKEIEENKTKVRGKTRPIYFRDDRRRNIERQVYSIPTIYLKFRKDNGRIASDIHSYEHKKGKLVEATDFGQEIIRGFLRAKDVERTKELKRTIVDRGQDEPAVITCDGFLINGNRRKMALELLSIEYPSESRYRTMEVVVLPGRKKNEDDETPPTYYEIEQIESAYQFHTHGKSEYTNFDKAISIRRKLDNGMSIEEQLSYDATFNMLSTTEKRKKIRQIEEDFLKPLECIDKYLDRLGRNGLYNTIATAKGSNKGQWQAFIDYYKSIDKYLRDPQRLHKLGISKSERGDVEDVAFKLIRSQKIQGVDKKSHELMRLIPKLLNNPSSKEELLRLRDEIKLKSYGETTKDAKDAVIKDLQWYRKNEEDIVHRVRKSYNIYLGKKESETPFELLKAALAKLNHENMNLQAIGKAKLKPSLRMAEQVAQKADEIKKEIYSLMKNHK